MSHSQMIKDKHYPALFPYPDPTLDSYNTLIHFIVVTVLYAATVVLVCVAIPFEYARFNRVCYLD